MADQDPDERFSIDLDPEDALRGLLKVDPSESTPGSKRAKLDWITKATAEELANPAIRDSLIQEARETDASWDEINAALDAPR